MNQRRKFLIQFGAVTVMALLAPRATLARLPGGAEATDPSGDLSKDDFKTMLRSSFYFYDTSARYQAQVKLVQVRDYSSSTALEQFGLVFRGSSQTPLPEGLYTASGWNRAPFQIFIKPIKGDARRCYYVADFSLLQ